MKFLTSFLVAFALVTLSANLAFSQSTDATQQEVSTQTSTFTVKGITCTKDLGMISDNVKKREGVVQCEVVKKGATSRFKVVFNPALVTEKEIHAAIENTGSCEDPNERPYKVKR